MLVLSRKKNEQIVIGPPGPNQVVITLVEMRGDKARIGIEADKDIPVHRREVYEAIHGSRGGRGELQPKPKDHSKEGGSTPIADSVPATNPNSE